MKTFKQHELLKFINAMKKMIYLLLIALLFASCKKNENKTQDENATNEITIKGKWKSVESKTEYYDADGNLVTHEDIEVEDKGFYMEFDGNNKVVFTNFNNVNQPLIRTYIHQSNYLILFGKNTKAKTFISQLTPDSMTWKAETEGERPDDLDPQDPISQSIVKSVNYLTFIKVKP